MQHLSDEDEVEPIPSRIPEAALDSDVDLNIIQQYLTPDGWTSVLSVMKVKGTTVKWKCQSCRDPLEEEPSIRCDSCLTWHHQVGATIKTRNIDADRWFCKRCIH